MITLNYLIKPNLPENDVTLCIADADISGMEVIKPPVISALPSVLQKHADLGICIISAKKAVCPPESCAYYESALSPFGFEIICGKSSVGCNYPDDCAYNVGIVGNKCFLNKDVCDKVLYEILISEGYQILHTKQGYAKCSLCPVDENSFITADPSIAKAGISIGMDVLLITNESIELSGYSYGFFGGCCGLSGKHKLLVNGEIETHPDNERIKKFLSKKEIEIKSLRKGKLLDIGSILPLLTI